MITLQHKTTCLQIDVHWDKEELIRFISSPLNDLNTRRFAACGKMEQNLLEGCFVERKIENKNNFLSYIFEPEKNKSRVSKLKNIAEEKWAKNESFLCMTSNGWERKQFRTGMKSWKEISLKWNTSWSFKLLPSLHLFFFFLFLFPSISDKKGIFHILLPSFPFLQRKAGRKRQVERVVEEETESKEWPVKYEPLTSTVHGQK